MRQILMHEDSMDVAFEVIHSHKHKPGHVTLKGCWINLGYMGRPWSISSLEKVEIKNEDMTKWKNITHSYLNVRTKSGLPPEEKT